MPIVVHNLNAVMNDSSSHCHRVAQSQRWPTFRHLVEAAGGRDGIGSALLLSGGLDDVDRTFLLHPVRPLLLLQRPSNTVKMDDQCSAN